MSAPFIPFEAEQSLNWLELTDALAAGHSLPKAEIGDTFLRRRGDTLLSRAAWIDGLGLAVKTATVFPGNQDAPPINGSVSLFSDDNGTLLASLDFHLVTKWKTAADSLLGALRLARKDSQKILIVGAGTVAKSLFQAYRAGFPDASFTVWNRTFERAKALASTIGAKPASDLQAAMLEADIITCATMSNEPVVPGEWLRPGQHLDLIGAYRADMRETDDQALKKGRIFVDSRDTTLDHIGELKIPLGSGAISTSDVLADFHDIASGAFSRRTDDEITIFKNGGGAHLDLMTCRYILDRHGAK